MAAKGVAPPPRPRPCSPPRAERRIAPRHDTVTAGMVDDNADFGEYLATARRNAGLPVRERDIAERYLLEVTTRPVARCTTPRWRCSAPAAPSR